MRRVPLSRSVSLFPSLCTTGSLFCGFFSIVQSLQGNYFEAVWAVFFAGFLDLVDGRLARMTRTQSAFGMEYDSLADVVSFGLAPALLLYTWGLHEFHRVGWLVSFAFVACGALRLARYNVQIQSVEKNRFQGLPIPMAAGLAVSYVPFSSVVIGPAPAGSLGALVIAVVLAPLMVTHIRYRSFKDFELKGRRAFYALLVAIGVILIIGIHVQVMPFVGFLLYVLSGPVEEVVIGLSHQRREERLQRRLTRRRLSVIRSGQKQEEKLL